MAHKSIKNAGQSVIRTMGQRLDDVSKLVVRDAIKNCGRDTGQLRASWQVKREPKRVVISFNTEYAKYHHDGTGIYAKDGGGRKTPWTYKNRQGQFRKTRGSKPNPFLKKAIQSNKTNIIKILTEV